ncbi:MAG TPA: sulfotransferase family 2 domain-containing protein [Pseudomonadales bacterium]|nr:sulfotransferase family 2 domain-containing protein [Pseudomonadales bacterium]
MTILHKAWLVIPRQLRLDIRRVLVAVFPSRFTEWLRNDMGFGAIKKVYVEKGCLLVHVPKTAGTSLGKALYGFEGIGHYTAMELRDLSPELYSRLFVIGFVRNPWDRLVSAYFFVVQAESSTVRVDKNTKALVDGYGSFRAFVVEWLASVDMRVAPIIFRPQYFFLCDENEKLIVDFVGHVETIDEDVKKIAAQLGREHIVLPRINQSSRGSYRDYFDEEMRDIVGRVYEKDIKFFGYGFDG